MLRSEVVVNGRAVSEVPFISGVFGYGIGGEIL
jgi:hypothetical protein